MPINVSRSIGYYRGKPGQNWLADDLQRMQDFMNRLESSVQAAAQRTSAPPAAANSTSAVKTTVAPGTVPVVVNSSDFHVHKTSNSNPTHYRLRLGSTGLPTINFSDLMHSGQVITPRYTPSSVTTEVIAAGAVTNSQQGVGTASTLPSGLTTLVSITISTGGLPMLLFGKANFTGGTGNVNNNGYALTSSSGGTLDESGATGWGISAGAFRQLFFLGYEAAPTDPATYTLAVSMTASGVAVDHILLTALNARR